MTERAHPLIIPTLRYTDARAAIDWLCDAFGFVRHLVVPGEGDSIAHAQLLYRNGMRNGMVMLSTASESGFGQLQKTPSAVGGASTQSPYVIVPDADAHCERAKAKGARIVWALRDQDYGGRGYSCTDPEGHLWSFGTYDPWAEV
ncbi:MAG TPA: glyoxalase [Deltaproteobacteria bacterium]|nr:glyoxalase [Deltaproteobacteria bacterium]